MRGVAVIGAFVCMAVSACADAPESDVDGTSSPYLFVWAADPDSSDSDFLSVIDIDEGSPTYGTIVTTLPVGLSGRAHHSEHVMPEGGRLP